MVVPVRGARRCGRSGRRRRLGLRCKGKKGKTINYGVTKLPSFAVIFPSSVLATICRRLTSENRV